MVKFIHTRMMVLQKSYILFIVVAVPVCLTLILCNKPFLGADEQWHTLRAWQTAHFQPYQSNNFDKNKLPKPLDDYIVGNWQAETNQPLSDSITIPNVKGETALDSSAEMVLPTWYSWSTSLYSFVPYLPAAIGMRTALLFSPTVPELLTFAKLSNAIFYILLLTLALYVLRNKRLQWLFFVVGLLPPVLYQAATITADTFTFAVTFLFLALILRENTEESPPTKPVRLAIVAVTVLMSFIKLAYVPFCLLLLFVRYPLYISYSKHTTLDQKLQLEKRKKFIRYFLERRFSIVLNILVFSIAIAFYRLGSYVSANKGNILGLDSRINPRDQINFMLTHLVDAVLMVPRTLFSNFSTYFLTNFGYGSTSGLAGLAYEIIVVLLVLLLIVHLENQATRLFNIIWTITTLGIVVLVFLSMYLGNTIPGKLEADGVAARYLLVIAPPIIYTISLFIPHRLKQRLVPTFKFAIVLIVTLVVAINITLIIDWYWQIEQIKLEF